VFADTVVLSIEANEYILITDQTTVLFEGDVQSQGERLDGELHPLFEAKSSRLVVTSDRILADEIGGELQIGIHAVSASEIESRGGTMATGTCVMAEISSVVITGGQLHCGSQVAPGYGIYGDSINLMMSGGELGVGGDSAYAIHLYSDSVGTMSSGTLRSSGKLVTNGVHLEDEAVFTLSGGLIQIFALDYPLPVRLGDASRFTMTAGQIDVTADFGRGFESYGSSIAVIKDATFSQIIRYK
jgi:hypothetical protein